MLFVCLPRPFQLIKCHLREAYNDRLTKKDIEMTEKASFIETDVESQDKAVEDNGESVKL